MCLSISRLHGDVYGIDESRHADSVRRLSGVIAAAVVVVVLDVWSPGHIDMVYALGVAGDVAAGAGTDTEDAEVAGENEGFGERRRELRPRSNWIDSNRVGRVGKYTQKKQKKHSRREREDPEQKRERRRQENGMESLDP